jgi:hypothetical protein
LCWPYARGATMCVSETITRSCPILSQSRITRLPISHAHTAKSRILTHHPTSRDPVAARDVTCHSHTFHGSTAVHTFTQRMADCSLVACHQSAVRLVCFLYIRIFPLTTFTGTFPLSTKYRRCSHATRLTRLPSLFSRPVFQCQSLRSQS